MLLRRKLGGILSSLTKVVKDLDDFVAQGTEDLGVNENKIVLLENKRDDISSGITQANAVASNLKVLLNVEQ